MILYGHEPRQWGPVNCSVPDLDLWLKERQMVTELLKQNLHRAQQLDPFSSLSLPILPQGLNHLAISFHLHFHPEPLSLANRTVSRHAISSNCKRISDVAVLPACRSNELPSIISGDQTCTGNAPTRQSSRSGHLYVGLRYPKSWIHHYPHAGSRKK